MTNQITMNEYDVIFITLTDYPNYQVGSDGSFYSLYSNKKIKQNLGRDGYYRAHLYTNSEHHAKLSHRLIAKAFIQNPENKPCVNHKNGIKTDNRVENLEWCTHKENIIHSYKSLGKKASEHQINVARQRYLGENNPKAKINKEIACDIKEMYYSGISATEIAKKFNLSRSYIHAIAKEKFWNNLKNETNMDNAVLHLALKKKWFDMILSGEKKEEYREDKQYWRNRLLIPGDVCDGRWYNEIHFTNGYGKKVPYMRIEFKGLVDKERAICNPNWGYTDNVFIIKLGKILETGNLK